MTNFFESQKNYYEQGGVSFVEAEITVSHLGRSRQVATLSVLHISRGRATGMESAATTAFCPAYNQAIVEAAKA